MVVMFLKTKASFHVLAKIDHVRLRVLSLSMHEFMVCVNFSHHVLCVPRGTLPDFQTTLFCPFIAVCTA